MKPLVLNRSDVEGSSAAKDKVVAQQLKRKMDQLKSDFYDLERGGVRYEALKGSTAFQAYQGAARALTRFDLDLLATREAKLAFWINIYNALVVHGIVALNIKESMKEAASFFRTVSYDVGGHVFALDDIEHGILRGNKKRHLFARRPFRHGDRRMRFILDEVDPRMHFALVCGANSCPPIDVYEEDRINEQLDLASDGFVNSEEVIIEKDRRRMWVSKIFKWYQDDFGGRDGVIAFIAKYRYDKEEKAFIEKHAKEIAINYNDYNWSLNAA